MWFTIIDQSVTFVDYFVAAEAFDCLRDTEDVLETSVLQNSMHNSCSASSMSDKENRNPWTKNEILQLLSLYKSHNHLFKSTTIKNDKVWSMISINLKSHTAEQCKNKFKYLKQKYIEKKDNMSTKASGATNIKFEYFNEMDEIFKDDANIVPVSVASSSRGERNLDDINEVVESNEESDSTDNSNFTVKDNLPKKSLKRKRNQMEKIFDNFEQNLQRREELKNQRHKELLERQDNALKLLEKMTDCFINIANKN